MTNGAADPFDSSPEEQTQKQVFIATFSMLAKLTSADGKVSKDEVQIIDRFMKNVLGLDAGRRAFAIDVFNKARRAETSFEEYARNYSKLLGGKPKMLEWMIDVLLRISAADEVFSDNERKLIETACSIFGISERRYKELQAKYSKGTQTESDSAETAARADSGGTDPYSVLKIARTATDQEITAQYKKLSVDYGPSRIIELGLPEEFLELAERKFAEIQQAYKTIKDERSS